MFKLSHNFLEQIAQNKGVDITGEIKPNWRIFPVGFNTISEDLKKAQNISQENEMLFLFAKHFERTLKEGLTDPYYRTGENIVFDSLKNEFGTWFLKKIYELILNRKEEENASN
jgi:hypothetical protein